MFEVYNKKPERRQCCRSGVFIVNYLSITFTVITRQIETIWTIKTIPQKISLVELVPGSRYGCDP